MKEGDRVKVLNNRHPDVLAGTEGIIDGPIIEGGFGVRITGSWMVAGGDRGQVYHGTEVCWYEPHELEIIHDNSGSCD